MFQIIKQCLPKCVKRDKKRNKDYVRIIKNSFKISLEGFVTKKQSS